MDLRQLRYFVAIAELGSFSSASRYLRVAQPALSRHIKGLEEELEMTLLQRTARGVKVTEPGRAFLEQASAILHQIDLIPDLIGGNPESVSGRVVVGLPTSASAVLSKPLIRAVRDRFPGIRLHLIESLSGFLENWLTTGRLDLCLLYNAALDHALEQEDILTEDLCLIGKSGTFHNTQETVEFAELVEYSLTMPGVSHSLRVMLDSMALNNGVALDVPVEIDSLAVILSVVADGDLFTLLPSGTVYHEVKRGQFEARRVVNPSISRKVSVLKSALRPQTRATIEVQSIIVELVEQLLDQKIWSGTRIRSEPVRPA